MATTLRPDYQVKLSGAEAMAGFSIAAHSLATEAGTENENAWYRDLRYWATGACRQTEALAEDEALFSDAVDCMTLSTALACILRALEAGEVPDGLGEMDLQSAMVGLIRMFADCAARPLSRPAGQGRSNAG